MLWVTTVVLWGCVSHAYGYSNQFPPGFKFGSATAAYQVEGAHNVSDKGECKWDRLTHRYPDMIKNHDNGDDACKSYYFWKRDIEMAAELGLQFYRFSISWPRLLPTGLPDVISQDGMNYYNNLIDGLLERGIEPVISIYHWEMPQLFQDLGGWANPKISDWFADYARLVFTLFGDRVKTWLTINEPIVECDWYYGPGILAPQLDYYVGPYLCNKNILLSHAKAYRIYDNEFRHKYNGKVSIVNHLLWLKPVSPQYEEEAEIARQFLTGRYVHPIYSEKGGWPEVVEETVARISREQGFRESRLPAFTQEEIDLIRGTYDFFAMNHYTTRLVKAPVPGEEIEQSVFTYISDADLVLETDPSWSFGFSDAMPLYPQGLREQMEWIRDNYGDVGILIAENGFSTTGYNLDDDDRVLFIRTHLEEVLLAIQKGVNVIGYTYWSLMDNFEWTSGYGTKFGLYEVDFTDPHRRRTPRKSAHYYAEIIRNRSLYIPPASQTNRF